MSIDACSVSIRLAITYIASASTYSEVRVNSKYVFYMDDFGTRTICKGGTDASSPAHELTFALGGVIVASEDVEALASNVKDFCEKWGVPSLHGNKIRSGKGKFGFLKTDEAKRAAFFGSGSACPG